MRELTPRLTNQRRPKQRSLSATRLAENQRVGAMVRALNRYLRGWHWYFKGVWCPYPERAFERFDRFVRTRLRIALTGRVGNGWWHVVLTNRRLYRLGLVRLDGLQADWRAGRLSAPVRKH